MSGSRDTRFSPSSTRSPRQLEWKSPTAGQSTFRPSRHVRKSSQIGHSSDQPPPLRALHPRLRVVLTKSFHRPPCAIPCEGVVILQTWVGDGR